MFKCQVLGIQSKLGEKCHRLVISRESKDYYDWRLDEETDKYVWTKIGTGWQIKREINATQEGVEAYNSWTPEQQETFAKSLDKPIKQEKTF